MNARHIIHIREALWKRPERGACVMVGAGLSRQTDSSQSTVPHPPSWTDLAVLFQKELLCGRSDTEPGSGREHVTARDCSRLAQQYKAAFGQSSLDSFLLEHVPNGQPASVHERLLRLPWADVFTTNWDTLLEKASRRVFERTYDPVLCPADLATAVAPRIVKLHGSFPSNRPFVVTEEDYRTYPTRFAPLVNTVQQALMESVFLLVGFSGDDPNFLHWCGWVRDQLGASAPRLYLAGLLGLNRPNRLLLEERGVIPIDLASEFSGAADRDAGHRQALEWILGSLEAGETQEQRWPLPPTKGASARVAGSPLAAPPSGQPRAEPRPVQGEGKPLTEQIKSAADVWRHNRRVYPDWPILPYSKHGALSRSTRSWIVPMLRGLSALDPPDRLSVVRELIERIELLMDPLTPELAEAATDTLTAADGYLAENDGLPDERTNAIHEDRAALMLALLTDARHDLDQARFDDWERPLEGIVQLDTPAFHRLLHERCLWKLWVQDFTGLSERLKDWRTADADPMWSLRKAALLVASGEMDDTQRLAQEAIERAERAWSRDRRVPTAARFGWAALWREALDLGKWWEGLRRGDQSSRPQSDLWVRLALHDADARSDLDAYVREMTQEQQDDSPWTFDLGQVHSLTVFANAEGRLFHAAWRVIRVIELSGLPFGIPGVRVTSDHTDRAARVFAPRFPAYAARLLLVGGSGQEKALNAVVSQTHLARVSDEEAAVLFESAQRARDHFLGRWTSSSASDDFLRERAQNAIEIMSRCVVRHGAASAAEVFRWAVSYRRPRRWVDNPFWSTVDRLWQRSWDAMDLDSRTGAVPEILRAPIPDDAFITAKDPGDLLLDALPGIRRSDVEESLWSSCVHQLCTAFRGSEAARYLAFDRLHPLARRHLLTAPEEQEVALSLWGTVHHEPTGLPTIRKVSDWVYLTLPEPEVGMAERRFRAKWIGPEATEAGAAGPEETILNVAAAWNPENLGARAIGLSESEEEWFWAFVEEWIRPKTRQRMLLGTLRPNAVRLLVDLLSHRQAPASLLNQMADTKTRAGEGLTRIADEWEDPGSDYRMIAAAAAFGQGDTSDAEDRLRLGTRASDARVSLASWQALRWWLRRCVQTRGVPTRPPSMETVREIGVTIGTSQQSGLLGALAAATAVYESGNLEFIGAIHSQTTQGLQQLRTELDYRAGVADRRSSDELPLRRQWCVSLAWNMADAEHGDDEVIRSWIEAGDNDPLCLVRFTREWHAASRSGGSAEVPP
ncbi:MAG: SIR2 family protein [Acidobacteriota bacterium]|nr:SIR2 family protein [Acidobacteriota bacterium]